MSKATNSPASETKPAAKVVVKTPAEIEAATIVKAEAKLVTKYGSKIVVGSVRRATDAKYGKKLMCEINTRGIDGEFDGNTRTIATSDVFQVSHTLEVAAELRKIRATDKRAAAKADRAEATPVSEEDLAASGL
jgi:hypothetical protein